MTDSKGRLWGSFGCREITGADAMFQAPSYYRLITRVLGRTPQAITVREGDIDAAGDDDTRVERAELDSGHFPLRGRDAWYGFSLLVPNDFPIVDDRLVIAQFKTIGCQPADRRPSVSEWQTLSDGGVAGTQRVA